jgi:hypothetical protein
MKDRKTKENERVSLFVLMDKTIEWTYNIAWTQQDFESCTREDQPTLAAAKGGPECNSLILNVWDLNPKHELKQHKLQELKERNAELETGLWMYLETKTEKRKYEMQILNKALNGKRRSNEKQKYEMQNLNKALNGKRRSNEKRKHEMQSLNKALNGKRRSNEKQKYEMQILNKAAIPQEGKI